MLWINGHETPFEKGTVHFLVDTDIASHIHLLKHRISSLNAESARYKELKEFNKKINFNEYDNFSKHGPSFSNNVLKPFYEDVSDWDTISLSLRV